MSIGKKTFDIEVGTGIIKSYERIDIENHSIFSEFIDNSFQSFLDHEEKLIKDAHMKLCKIEISWTNDEIVVKDYSFGMDEESFGRALKMNAPSDHYSKGSLSKYGMGLKYAAINLAGKWIIESTAYGSHYKYKGIVDAEEWANKNPKVMDVEVDDDYDLDSHFTKITFVNLKHSFSQAELLKTIKKLGIIYGNFISKKKLSIVCNKTINVTYSEPELLDDKDGGQLQEFINGRFNHDGKTYEYSGWIGVLKKGSTDDAGLRLTQNDRVITLNYRPQEIYGKVNDFRQQRVVGEIIFVGDNWQVRLNKDGLAWLGTGLQERFLEDLKNKKEVVKILKLAKEYRAREKPKRDVDFVIQNGSVDRTKNSYKIGERVCFTVQPFEGYRIKSVKVMSSELSPENEEHTSYSFIVDAGMPDKIKVAVMTEQVTAAVKFDPKEEPVAVIDSGKVIVDISSEEIEKEKQKNLAPREKLMSNFKKIKHVKIPGLISEQPKYNEDGIIVEFENTTYSFDIEEIKDSNEQFWIQMKEYPGFENSYTIEINYGCGVFADTFLSNEVKNAINTLAISFCLARLTSQPSGLVMAESKKLLLELNKILTNTGR